MSIKQGRSYNFCTAVYILRAGNNALHFSGHNFNGIITDGGYVFIGSVIVDSYKGHFLLGAYWFTV